MSRMDFMMRNFRRNRQRYNRVAMIIFIGLIAAVVLIAGIYFIAGNYGAKQAAAPEENVLPAPPETAGTEAAPAAAASTASETTLSEADTAEDIWVASSSIANAGNDVKPLLLEADRLAQGYDYDGAISMLRESSGHASDPAVLDAIACYETVKSNLVQADIKEITHVFFHSLIIDTDNAFSSKMKDGYNQMMTTREEFLNMMQSMYDRGYVLVRIHDMAHEEIGEDGTARMVPGDIWLPEGKIPFVLSEDDVCYYEYMTGDGFASRIIIGEDGKPTCEMKLDDGTTVTGAFDVVPILNDFIEKHPDFSYKGAKGILAFTGYDGILGYRTAPSYSSNPTYEEDKKAAAAVAQALRDDGWELASHSWGHRDMGKISYEDFKTDTDKWESEVESLIGPTDIILFPFGSDVGDWKPYSEDNERFRYLKSVGFRYFCNVDGSRINWVQLGDNHLRQGRRNLDGYRMYYHPELLSDLFDTSQVFDASRPLPVPPMQ